MPHPTLRRAAVVLAGILLLAACGDDDTTTATEATTTTADDGAMADAGDMDHGDDHDHGAIDVADWATIPSVTAEAFADPKSGVNLHVELEGFAFAPEHASGEAVEGEGHAHVYVDGTKVARLYTEWIHLPVDPGDHEITVGLNGNDHSALELDGEPIEDTVSVTVPEAAEGHAHGDGFEADDPAPTVSLEVLPDAKSGWNLHLTTTDFTFTPEKASTMETTSGEGHAHLYVDGAKVTRLYGDWFHFDGDLPPGEHEFRVELSANDHSPYLAGGEPIDAVQTVTVEGEVEPVDEAALGTILELVVDGQEVAGGGRQSVGLGDTVTLRVTSDIADEVHLHGYDLHLDVEPGVPGDLTFVADIPGIFEVELEDARIPLVDLEVS